LECGAHAVLQGSDFFVYSNNECHIGTLNITTSENEGLNETSTDSLRILKENSEIYINDCFSYWFRLPGETLKSCGFESVILHPDQSLTDCGIKCILSATTCDFFYYEFPKCYLAAYNCTSGLDVPVPSEFKSYHNLENYRSSLWENFQKFGSKNSEVGDWDRWIFKVELSRNR
jgi:hypothetical protein